MMTDNAELAFCIYLVSKKNQKLLQITLGNDYVYFEKLHCG